MDKRKKICIICPYSYPIPAVRGGAVETLAQFLIDENESHHRFDFTLLTTYDEEAGYEKYKYADFVCFKNRRLPDKILEFIFRGLKKLFKLYIPCSTKFMGVFSWLRVHGGEFDYILFENGMTYMLPMLAKIVGKEKILNHLHYEGDGNRRIDDAFAYLLPVSGFIRDAWVRKTGRSEDRIIVWPNACDLTGFRRAGEVTGAERENLKQELGISDSAFTVIFVGRILPEKGIKELIQAAELLTGELHLIVIGRASFGNGGETLFEQEIKRMAAKSRHKVSLTGFIKNEELYRYYAISDLAVMPTLADESAGMVNIEAMAAGVPLITTNKGGVLEYVGEGFRGCVEAGERFVYDLSKKIEEYRSNPGLRREMAEEGKRRAEQFSTEQYYLRFSSIIDQIGEAGNAAEI